MRNFIAILVTLILAALTFWGAWFGVTSSMGDTSPGAGIGMGMFTLVILIMDFCWGNVIYKTYF